MRRKIKAQRALYGINQTQLAKATGLTRQSIHAIEAGKVNPKIGVAARIANYFRMSIEELFEND